MQRIKRTVVSLLTGVTFFASGLSFNACTQRSPLESSSDTAVLNKNPHQRIVDSALPESGLSTTVTVEKGSMVSRYYKGWDEYQGGKIILSQGSQFELLYGSLTPPADLYGNNVTLTMTCTEDNATGELLFEFGPHGSVFEPAATVYFHYTGSNPVLYYIEEDGTYTEQQPDDVDTQNQWLILKVHHFSRYAVAWSR